MEYQQFALAAIIRVLTAPERLLLAQPAILQELYHQTVVLATRGYLILGSQLAQRVHILAQHAHQIQALALLVMQLVH